MKYFQETTEWNTSYSVPNHVYYMKDDRTRAVGYIPVGSKTLVKFTKPMSIDTRGRKFVALDRNAEPDSAYFSTPETTPPSADVKIIAGSGNKKYFLTKNNGRWTCTCPGYTFRRTCKHTQTL